MSHAIRRVLGVGLLGVAVCASVARAQNVDWPSERAPRALPVREVRFPPYEVRSLANGLEVIAVLHHEQPVVSMRLLVRAGSVQDPAGKIGVANLMASLLDQGTTTRSAQQIADQIDFIGGALGTGSGPDLSFVNAIVMKDSFGIGLDLLADVARHPAFAADEIARQKERLVSTLQVNSNDPDYVANVVFDRLVFGFHPYGLSDSGTPDAIASMTRADLDTYHRTYFVPNNMILAIVGDVTADEAFAGAERAFGGWPRGDVPAIKIADPPQPTRRIVIVDKPDSVQTEIRVGQLGIPRKHPDYMAYDLAVKILGGEGANRLHRVLRSERGLTYGASADTEARKQGGNFVAETDTRTETTGEALRLMIDEIAKLPRDRVGDRELSDAQAYLAGSFPLSIETPNDIVTQILNVVFYELPVSEIGTFRERVQAVTPEDIQRVARQFVRPDRLSIVLVGNAAAFIQQLQRVGFSDFEVIPIAQLDLTSPTLKRETRRASFESFGAFGPFGSFPFSSFRSGALAYVNGLNESNASNDQKGSNVPNVPNAPNALALLKRIVDAKGGLDALTRVRTVVADADTTFQMPQGPLVSKTKTYVLYPDKFRVDANVAGADVVQIYNSGSAWLKDPSGVHDAPPPMRDDFAASVRRDTIPMLLGALEGQYATRLLPDETSGGRLLKGIEISGAQLAPVRLFVDPQNLIVRQTVTVTAPDGRSSVTNEEWYSDYRRVEGLQVPFKADVRRNNQVILTRTITNLTINGPLNDTLFAKPQ